MNMKLTLTSVIGPYTFFAVHLVFLNSVEIVFQIIDRCQE